MAGKSKPRSAAALAEWWLKSKKTESRKYGRVFGPVETEAVDIGILVDEVTNESVFVAQDVRAGERTVLWQASGRNGAIGQKGTVVFGRSAELHTLAGRNGGLHLEVNFRDGGPGRRG